MVPSQESARDNQSQSQLLNAVAEHLKLPLLYMRQHAELARFGGEFSPDFIESAADSGLLMVENYIHWQQISEQPDMQMESSSLSSIFYDVAQRLDSIAKSHNGCLQLNINGRYGPITTNRRTLEAALQSLGLAFIEATQDDSPVVMGIHKTRWGIVAGVYSKSASVTADMFKCSKILGGSVRQPMPGFSHSSMSGMFLADALFGSLSQKLRISKHHHMSGLGTTLKPNPQLMLL